MMTIESSSASQSQVDINRIATDLNGKADVDLTNCTKPHIVESYVNGTSWYRVYSDGWCEQGGIVNPANTATQLTLNLLHNFIDNKYSIFMTINEVQLLSNYLTTVVTGSKTTNNFTYSVCGYDNNVPAANISIYWQACGYIR